MPHTGIPNQASFRELITAALSGLERCGIDVNAVWPQAAARQRAIDRLERLLDVVVTWNARIDLTAARDAPELVDLFVADALVLASERQKMAARSHPEPQSQYGEQWLDIGSGAGAPGLVFGILCPEQPLTLVEPRAKRVAFLRSALGTLGLGRVVVQSLRSDALPEACCDVALSRATFAPADWLREGARLSRGLVWVLLAKAEPPALEGWSVVHRVDYRWPLRGGDRHALAFARD